MKMLQWWAPSAPLGVRPLAKAENASPSTARHDLHAKLGAYVSSSLFVQFYPKVHLLTTSSHELRSIDGFCLISSVLLFSQRFGSLFIFGIDGDGEARSYLTLWVCHLEVE